MLESRAYEINPTNDRRVDELQEYKKINNSLRKKLKERDSRIQ